MIVFDNHGNIMMYDNNVILQLYKTNTHTKSKYITAPFDPNTKKATHVISLYKSHYTSLTNVFENIT
jgi:hypothetical protein